MSHEKLSRPAKIYALRTLGFLIAYVLVLLLMVVGREFIDGTPVAFVMVAAVTVPILGQTWALVVFMRDSDEFVRALTAKRFIVASGLAVSLFAGWGFAETFAGAPHLEGYYVYALFWAAFGLVTPLVRSSE